MSVSLYSFLFDSVLRLTEWAPSLFETQDSIYSYVFFVLPEYTGAMKKPRIFKYFMSAVHWYYCWQSYYTGRIEKSNIITAQFKLQMGKKWKETWQNKWINVMNADIRAHCFDESKEPVNHILWPSVTQLNIYGRFWSNLQQCSPPPPTAIKTRNERIQFITPAEFHTWRIHDQFWRRVVEHYFFHIFFVFVIQL